MSFLKRESLSYYSDVIDNAHHSPLTCVFVCETGGSDQFGVRGGGAERSGLQEVTESLEKI